MNSLEGRRTSSLLLIEEEFDELLSYVDDLVFNSPAQVKKFGPVAKAMRKSIGLRINPECSTQEGHAIYDPCSPGSRLGTTLDQMDESILPLLDGLHFHTLCEQNSDDLETTVKAVEEKFGKYLSGMKWLNLGGGHHITREDYDVERLIRIIRHLRDTYDLTIYLEPGEAVVLNAGFLVTSVMEIFITTWILPFWTPRQPAICRMLLKCLTGLR